MPPVVAACYVTILCLTACVHIPIVLVNTSVYIYMLHACNVSSVAVVGILFAGSYTSVVLCTLYVCVCGASTDEMYMHLCVHLYMGEC